MLLHIVSVFLGPGDSGGNLLGVFTDAAGIAPERRQEIAADLGYAETVFVTDRATGALRIHTAAVELPLAGHPLVGTAWLLGELGTPLDVLRPAAGEVPTWREGDLTWFRADPVTAPPFQLERAASPAAVDAHPGSETDWLDVWAWSDEAAGRVRSRVFAPEGGTVIEDEATGSAAMVLTAVLGRDLDIRQGAGSQIRTRHAADGLVEVGGRCRLVDTREY